MRSARLVLWVVVAIFCVIATNSAFIPAGAAEPETVTPTLVVPIRLPMRIKKATPTPPFGCPATSENSYGQGPAYQYDVDNPVRPAAAHADKNFALRGYVANTDSWLHRELVNYGTNPTLPPQLATLFSPQRVPPLVGFYRVHDWNWSLSPNPGTRGAPLTSWPATALGLQVTPGEVLRVPASDYDIGQGDEVIVVYADERRVALRYAREDSVSATGYTVHVDGICTDPNLLWLYAQLDAVGGSRYVYRPPNQGQYIYPLPVLSAGQPIGVARSNAVVVAVVDTGTFMDPRSCNEWWQIRPLYKGTCPPHELSALTQK